MSSLSTPALIVDSDAFERNIASARALSIQYQKSIRPHVKTHRTPALALRQLEGPLMGLTCATVGEAEAMVHAGARNVLVANEVVTFDKIERLAILARDAAVSVAVDDVGPLRAVSEAASRHGVRIGILVDVDIGLGRCGVRSVAGAVSLGLEAASTPGVELHGLMGYEGRYRSSDAQREANVSAAFARLASTRAAFVAAGLSVGTVSASGTSTLLEALRDPTITEIQAGTYVLMEDDLKGLGLPFVPAIAVIATVISQHAGVAVLDAGRKSLGVDYGPPRVLGQVAQVVTVNEEHTVIRVETARSVGERVALRPSNVRTTFNLHDEAWLVREHVVLERLVVSARGCSW